MQDRDDMNARPGHIAALKWLMVIGLAGLLAGCAFPKRDYSMVPDASVIKVELQDGRWVAVPPECAHLFTEQSLSSWHAHKSRPQVAFGCATYTNLANSVARPFDLLRPQPYGGQHAESAAEAVTRYRQNEVTPLRNTSSTTITGN